MSVHCSCGGDHEPWQHPADTDLQALLTNRQVPDANRITVTVEELRALTTAQPTPQGFAEHPGEPHHFKSECITCGEPGQLFVAILGPDEHARIEKR